MPRKIENNAYAKFGGGWGGGGGVWGHIRCIMGNVEVAYTGLLGFAPVGSTFVIKVCSVPTHSGSS